MRFSYPAKGGIRREVTVQDAQAAALVARLRRSRASRRRLLAWCDDDGDWHEVRSTDINSYLQIASGTDMTAKDLRTWHATVLAATALAVHGAAASTSRAKKIVAQVVREVAEELGNTPTVARSAYIDPVVIDRYLHAETVPAPTRRSGPAAEKAVMRLLDT